MTDCHNAVLELRDNSRSLMLWRSLFCLAALGLSHTSCAVAADTTARGIERVSAAAQQLWAEALFESFPTFRDEQHAESTRTKLIDAASKSSYPPPILVALAELELDNERFAAIESLQLGLLRLWAEESSRPKNSSSGNAADRGLTQVFESGIPRLLARSTSSSDRCLLQALQHDPGYLPALERLAWSEDVEARKLAHQAWRGIDPENATPWLIEAALLVSEDRFDEALRRIESAGECPRLESYPTERPQKFEIAFPEGELATAISEKFADARVAGAPITPTVLSNLRLTVADIQSFLRPNLSRPARSLGLWARDEIENARRCGDASRIRRLNMAMRQLGRLMILQQPQDGLSIVGGMYLLDASLSEAPRTPEIQRVLEACQKLRLAWRDNYNAIDPQRIGRGGLPVWLTGEVDRSAAMQDAAVRAIASSNIVAALEALPASFDLGIVTPAGGGCLPSCQPSRLVRSPRLAYPDCRIPRRVLRSRRR